MWLPYECYFIALSQLEVDTVGKCGLLVPFPWFPRSGGDAETTETREGGTDRRYSTEEG